MRVMHMLRLVASMGQPVEQQPVVSAPEQGKPVSEQELLAIRQKTEDAVDALLGLLTRLPRRR